MAGEESKKLFSNWSGWDTVGAIGIALLLAPPLAIVIAAVWGAKRLLEAIGTGFSVVSSEIGGFFKSVRKVWHDFWWGLRARWRAWGEREPKEPGEPTIWDTYREIIRRYRENCAVVRMSPMSAEAKRAALANEERVLEERIGQLLR